MEIPPQRLSRSRPRAAHAAIESAADADSLSRSRVHGIKTFFSRIRLSSDSKGKMRERRSTRRAPDVVDVPLGQATYVRSPWFF
ncbi:hypothetical protein M405DRAFT_803385 [Rhizopogon salebrosus TDB-379]|nr:hypothetical protein M405DRAFT_803385 [Rhizopogon salebrosus TDB-379]